MKYQIRSDKLRKLVFAINVTLDGFADHQVMIADDELHEFFTDLLRRSDAALYGRVTYELLADYWPLAPDLPTSTPSEIEFANEVNRIPKVVFSKTLEKAEWNNTRLVKGDAIEEIRKLKAQPGKDLQVGGLSLVSNLTNLNLIDEYWLLVHPIVSGKGRRLFNELHQRVSLKLLETKTLHSGVVALHYQVIPL
jgi:dihydrofolate reductase